MHIHDSSPNFTELWPQSPNDMTAISSTTNLATLFKLPPSNLAVKIKNLKKHYWQILGDPHPDKITLTVSITMTSAKSIELSKV